MGETKYDWTDKTKTGLSKEEYDALWAQNNINEADISDLGDDIAAHDHDATYLKLTGGVMSGDIWADSGAFIIRNASNPSLWLVDTNDAAYTAIFRQNGTYTEFYSGGTKRFRFQQGSSVLELPCHEFKPSGLENSRVAFYQDDADQTLWAIWKEADGSTHHAPVARSKRTIVSLSPGMATLTGSATHVVIGANTDISAVRFPDGSTNTAAWAFARPYDWDAGTLTVTVWWTNYNNNVSGNHYWPQRLVGCSTGEHLAATQTCNPMITGAQTTAGLNDSSKIGVTEISGSPVNLTNEEFFNYRIQRQGGNGSDTSGQAWEVIMVTVENTTT
jgi:hypothetical protein